MKNNLHREEAKVLYDGAFKLAKWLGYLTQHEVMILHVMSKDLEYRRGKAGIMVNIGVGAGTSSLALRESNQLSVMHSVDISEGGPLGGLESERNAFGGENLSNLLPNQILGDSKQVGKDWSYGKIDLLFIDGDHSKDGLEGDINSWIGNMVQDGYILFHDYGSNFWPDVKPIVDAEKRVEVIMVIDTIAVAKVKKVKSK